MIRMQGMELLKGHDFKYLGSTIQSRGRCEEENTGRMDWMEMSVRSGR